MSEIEKMFENAGIKPIKNWQSCLNCKLKTETRYDDWGEEYITCNRLERPEECSDAKEYYPIFTAEKQLRLTTFIGLRYGFQMLKNEAFDYIIATKIYVKYEYEYKGYGYGYNEAIANLVNNLWQDLTSEEKQQVKEILE